MNWNKESVLRFFQSHEGKTVSIREKTSRIKIHGKVADICELDLCSSTLFEATLELQTAGLQVTLTFHNDVLATHLISALPNSRNPEMFIPYQIAYDQLIVESI
ncbi:MAG: hypothetical protein HQM14_17070 [SAR324 cluster bacterium]|nr:hypothetical protein [SAR324 cluster bacterium]